MLAHSTNSMYYMMKYEISACVIQLRIQNIHSFFKNILIHTIF